MSVLTDIASAVATELNAAPAGTFEPTFTAQRVYLPQYDLKDMIDLHVTVVPKGVVVQSASRAVSQYDYSIDVAVQKKLLAITAGGTTDPAEIDPLCLWWSRSQTSSASDGWLSSRRRRG